VLQSSKEEVLKKYDQLKVTYVENLDPILNKTAGFKFHNKSKFDLDKLIAVPKNNSSNLRN
jgi:type I restriction enzyme M protein